MNTVNNRIINLFFKLKLMICESMFSYKSMLDAQNHKDEFELKNLKIDCIMKCVVVVKYPLYAKKR